MLDEWINFFVLLFVVVDPVGLAPMYAGLSRHHTDEERRRMANQATRLAAGILLLFAVAGPGLLRILGIGMPAFRMAGGLLLLLLAVDMVFARQSGLRSTTLAEQDEARTRQDVSVFPLAFPLIAGPGALTIVLLTFGAAPARPWWHTGGLYMVILVVLALTALALHLASPMVRLLGRTGTNVIDRLFGVLLAALAVQFMVDGWQALETPSPPGAATRQVRIMTHDSSPMGLSGPSRRKAWFSRPSGMGPQTMPVPIGFMAPAPMPWALKASPSAAVTCVLPAPTPVSVPAMKGPRATISP